MNERITLISLLDENNINKIHNMINQIHIPLCKVPFGKNVDDRMKMDTLPYHFTLSAWDIQNESFIMNELLKITFHRFNILVDSIEIMNGKENSYVLYFHIKTNDELKLLQEKIYNLLSSKHYHPDKFQFHITITIDKDYNKISTIKKELERNFIPFELEITKIGLFEIYPAKFVTEINCR